MEKIVSLKKEDYGRWNEFCLKSKDAWFWHTTFWLDYILELREGSVSKSFYVELDGRIVAICLLTIQDNKFWSNNKFCLLPAFGKLNSNVKKRIEKMVFTEVEKIARENQIKNIYMRYVPLVDSLINSKYPPFNILLKYGFIADSWSTHIIDLTKDLETLWGEVRHGHQSAIKKSSKQLKRVVWDKNNVTKKDFDLYRLLHHKDAGRITRPISTFDLMYDFINKGYAFIVAAKREEEFVGFSYFFLYKNKVYYGSSATDGNKDTSTAHFILWEAIKYMEDKGMTDFEIGYQYYDQHQIISPTEKERVLGEFKKGFGGELVPVFAGRKYVI